MDTDWDVFLCHNSKDKPEVEKIRKHLDHRGFKAWMDKYDFEPFKPWTNQLEAIISHTKVAALFIGSSGLGPWQANEIELFVKEFAQRHLRMGLVILPSCPDDPVQNSGIAKIVKEHQWVDFRQSNPDPMEQLIFGITGQKTDLLLEPEIAGKDISSTKNHLERFKTQKENIELRVQLYKTVEDRTERLLEQLRKEMAAEELKIKELNKEMTEIESILRKKIDKKLHQLLDYLSRDPGRLARKFGHDALSDFSDIKMLLENDEQEERFFYLAFTGLLEKIRLSFVIKEEFDFYNAIQKLPIRCSLKEVYVKGLNYFLKSMSNKERFNNVNDVLNKKVEELISCISSLDHNLP